MPREPKPYFRKAVCTINGNRVTLGKIKDAAMAKYHQRMLKPQTVSSELSTIYDLSQVYLDWFEKHRKKSTYDNQKRVLWAFSWRKKWPWAWSIANQDADGPTMHAAVVEDYDSHTDLLNPVNANTLAFRIVSSTGLELTSININAFAALGF